MVAKLDLSDFRHADKARFISELCASLEEYGFARIRGHGIDQATLKAAYELNQALFALPVEVKQPYTLEQLGVRGYTAFGKETAVGEAAADLKEFWHIGKELSPDSKYHDVYPANFWPSELPEFKHNFLALFSQLESIALEILDAIAIGLNIPEAYFPGLVDDGNSVLRLIHYPPVAGLDTSSSLRAAAHADINLMTLLVGATDSGLQLLDRQGQWLDVETGPDEIVIDTGDMMALITGGHLPSTVHRVVNPSDTSRARYSMPFFLHPHSDALLECLPQFENTLGSQAITAGDFLNERLAQNGLS